MLFLLGLIGLTCWISKYFLREAEDVTFANETLYEESRQPKPNQLLKSRISEIIIMYKVTLVDQRKVNMKEKSTFPCCALADSKC